jgi:hypothetical protein
LLHRIEFKWIESDGNTKNKYESSPPYDGRIINKCHSSEGVDEHKFDVVRRTTGSSNTTTTTDKYNYTNPSLYDYDKKLAKLVRMNKLM